MGGCQNYGPFFWVLNIIRHLLFRVPKKGLIILTTTHMVGGVLVPSSQQPQSSLEEACGFYNLCMALRHSRRDCLSCTEDDAGEVAAVFSELYAIHVLQSDADFNALPPRNPKEIDQSCSPTFNVPCHLAVYLMAAWDSAALGRFRFKFPHLRCICTCLGLRFD